MDIHEVKQRLQNHFTDGLVTVVGSGLSSGEGLPAMSDLASHLAAELPSQIEGDDRACWDEIVQLLNDGSTIEEAMLKRPPNPTLEMKIVDTSADMILQTEARVIDQVIRGDSPLRLATLFPYMLKPRTGIPIITTNYDRLIEVAAEMSGLGVDTLFAGHNVGVLNEKESRMSFCRGVRLIKKSHVSLTFTDRILLLKPHGSLDWFLRNDEPVRCPLNLSLPRLIITPGLNKFRTGYARPFDTHREKANECIDRATRFLIIGYGFNDDHLQTHLVPKLREGAPTLVLVRTLSDNAKKLVADCDGIIALTAPEDKGQGGTCYVDKVSSEYLPGPNLWDLGVFVREVLEP